MSSSARKVKEEIITLLIEHSRIMYSVTSDMVVYYSSWAEDFENNRKTLEKKKVKMQLSEEEADELKIRLIQNFSEAQAFKMGAYVNLVLRMDNIINYPLEFVDMLSNINLKEKKEKEIKKKYHKLLNEIIEMVDILKTTLKNLRDKPDIVFDNTTSIHELESRIDKTYRQFLEFIYTNIEDFRTLLRVRDSIVLLEQMADRVHYIADMLRVLLYQ
jgi:MoaA/NifB/PqqE/SkfB family radical SAM enzyme